MNPAGILGYLRPAVAPALILLAAWAAVRFAPLLPQSLWVLLEFGPYVVLLPGIGISLWFNRGRAFITLASLFLAYAGHRLVVDMQAGVFAQKALFTALAVIVPLNVLAALAFAERGVYQHRNYRWVLVGVAEALLVAWIAGAGRSFASGTFWHDVLDHWLLASPPTPLLGRIVMALAFALALWRGWRDRSPLDNGIAGAMVALLAACEWAETAGTLSAFVSASGAILLVALLEESHRLAFSDLLTGLPGRRAFEERLSGLGPVHTIAMVDVDHFKQFNDTHGHEVGDQVLKLVAAQLSGIGGGGTAYRYGGEEFAVVFPGKRLEDVLPHLEATRASIEAYRMVIRGPDRPKDEEEGTARRGEPTSGRTLSVTVSIGVAEADETLVTPQQVIRAADKALYRAKRAGRNRVSR